MYYDELKKLLIRQALFNKLAYVPPPQSGGQPQGGMDPSMLMGMMGGMPGGGMPGGGGMPPDAMGGGLPPEMMGMMGGGDMGPGGPPGGQDTMGGLPPTDMSDVEPSTGGVGGGGDPNAQLRAAIAILKEGIKQLEKAVDALGTGGKTASYRLSYPTVTPMESIIAYLRSLG